jgi:TonB-linked SusC/RagA family outer membrane protein
MKRVLLLFFVFWVTAVHCAAQTTNITGKVLDDHGQGYPGAGVNVKGTAVGTVTDLDGNFMLEVPQSASTLVIQAVGYNPQEVKISGQTVTVHLQVMAKQLEGAVVTALAVKREKRELGYNATTIDNQDLTSGNNTSALSALEGKVAGANITSSTGGTGGSTRIVLRGEKSLTRDNNALIIIDGVITNNFDRTQDDATQQVDFGNSGNDIDPDDIESVTVLNGAQASALYGSIGANGAVMITTKSGKNRKKKLDVTYKVTYTQSDILKYPNLQHEFGQGNMYLGVADDRRENFSWGQPFNGQLRPWGQIINGQELVKPYVDQPDNVKRFFDHGKNLNNYVSLSGGDENTSYFLSLNALNSTGVMPNTFYNRYNVRINASTQLPNNFYSTINVDYINNYSRQPYGGEAIGSVLDNLLETARDIPIWELKNLSNKFYSMNFTDSSGVARYGYYGAYYKNPYWVSQNYDNRDRSDRVLGGFTIGWKKGRVDIYDRVGADITSDGSYFKSPTINSMPVDVNTSGLENVSWYGDNFISPGGYTEQHYDGLRLNNDVVVKYTQPLSNDFGMSALAGNNVRFWQDRNLMEKIDPNTNGLIIPNYYSFQNAQGPIQAANTQTDYRNTGLYGDVTLNFRREVYLDITARNDWSSTLGYPTLPNGHNSYFYPSSSISWIFTERLHEKIKNILNYGKLRAGVAQVGNDAPPYANNPAGYVQTIVNSAAGAVVFPFHGVPGYQYQTTFGDSALKPEITKTYEFGTDLSFFKDKISASFTYYDATTYNQITPVPLPVPSGMLFKTINLGTVRNSGDEVSVKVTPVATKSGFKWSLFGTYTHNQSIVEGLTGGASQIPLQQISGLAIVAAVGHPYGMFYTTDFVRDPQGHVVVDPNTGLPLTAANSTLQGSFQPRFIASWGTDLSYKGFRLHILFNTKQGGRYYSRNKQSMDFNGTSAETAYNNRNPYIWPGSVIQTGPNTYAPNTSVKFSPYNYYTNVEQFVPATGLVDASFIKLQEASLYYSVPQKLYKRSPFGTLEVGVYGTNLIIWTPKSNRYDDPEETSSGATGNGQGFNFSANPSMRNYGISLKATF